MTSLLKQEYTSIHTYIYITPQALAQSLRTQYAYKDRDTSISFALQPGVAARAPDNIINIQKISLKATYI